MSGSRKFLLAILVIGIAVYWFSQKEEEQQVETQEDLSFNTTYKVKKSSTVKEGATPKKPKVVTTAKPLEKDTIKKKQEFIEKQIAQVEEKLEGCRKKIEELVPSEELQRIESLVWDDEKLEAGNDKKVKDIEIQILEKIGTITTTDWHLDELGSVTSQLMNEELASSDPSWVLNNGGKLKPCGVYSTHRLLSSWVEILPPKNKNPDATFVERSLIEFAKKMLGSKLGGPGVAMQVELLSNMGVKGYFDKGLRDQITEMEKRMSEDFESRSNLLDGPQEELVKAIVVDFKEAERNRQDLLDIINQAFPGF